jgi:hypothetical protein
MFSPRNKNISPKMKPKEMERKVMQPIANQKRGGE